MKRGITTANAIIIAVIVIGSIFAINLLSSLSGVEDISGGVISKIGGFCGERMVFGKKVAYTCPSGSSCVNNVCKAITTPIPTIEQPLTTTQKLDVLLMLNDCKVINIGYTGEPYTDTGTSICRGQKMFCVASVTTHQVDYGANAIFVPCSSNYIMRDKSVLCCQP